MNRRRGCERRKKEGNSSRIGEETRVLEHLRGLIFARTESGKAKQSETLPWTVKLNCYPSAGAAPVRVKEQGHRGVGRKQEKFVIICTGSQSATACEQFKHVHCATPRMCFALSAVKCARCRLISCNLPMCCAARCGATAANFFTERSTLCNSLSMLRTIVAVVRPAVSARRGAFRCFFVVVRLRLRVIRLLSMLSRPP